MSAGWAVAARHWPLTFTGYSSPPTRPAWPGQPHVCYGLAKRSLKTQHGLERRLWAAGAAPALRRRGPGQPGEPPRQRLRLHHGFHLPAPAWTQVKGHQEYDETHNDHSGAIRKPTPAAFVPSITSGYFAWRQQRWPRYVRAEGRAGGLGAVLASPGVRPVPRGCTWALSILSGLRWAAGRWFAETFFGALWWGHIPLGTGPLQRWRV